MIGRPVLDKGLMFGCQSSTQKGASGKKDRQKKTDFFVFGHRHLPIDFRLNDNSRYINLGDWIRYFTYAVMDGEKMELKAYTGNGDKIYRNG